MRACVRACVEHDTQLKSNIESLMGKTDCCENHFENKMPFCAIIGGAFNVIEFQT